MSLGFPARFPEVLFKAMWFVACRPPDVLHSDNDPVSQVPRGSSAVQSGYEDFSRKHWPFGWPGFAD